MKNITDTIIITDPKYFAKHEDWKDMKFDWYTGKIDPDLGFTDYILELTGVGEGKWKVSEIRDEVYSGPVLAEFVEDIEDAYYTFFENPNLDNTIKLENLISKRLTIGRYSSDSGVYGVFRLMDILHYNPNFLTSCGENKYIIIKDFVGEISTYDDKRGQSHILGVGSSSFYSNTVSWL